MMHNSSNESMNTSVRTAAPVGTQIVWSTDYRQ